MYRLEQQGKLRVPTLGEVLAHSEWPRSKTPKPGEEVAIANFPRDSESCRSGQRAADRRDDSAMVTLSRDTVADARSGPIALPKSTKNLQDWQCDRGERGDAPVERSDLDEITLVSSERVAALDFSTTYGAGEEDSGPEEAHEIITRADIHERSEKNQTEDGRQIIYRYCSNEPRKSILCERTNREVHVQGTDRQRSTVLPSGPEMMQDLADRIMPSPTVIGFANSQDESSSGCLPVMLQIDREAGRVVLECVEILPVEMVLGADFGRRWRVDIGMGRDQWRSNDGPWHDFAKPSETKVRSYAITAECAGITVKPSERELVLQKVMRLIPDVSGELGWTDKIKHKIELIEGARPVCQRARRMSDKMEKIAIEHVSKMLRENIIEEACSEWNSAPVIVKKSDGSHRFCVDYRDLNKVTKKDGYPCKNMDEILDKLRKARYISKIDLKSAYHQVLMKENSKEYTAFSVPGLGQFQFRRLPFGLKCAPMTFQRLMDKLFCPKVEKHVFAYLDNIILFTETFEQHMVWLERVIRTLIDARLVVNREKGEFCCQSVKFLGYVLDSSGLRVDSDRARPIYEYPAPRNVKQVRRLLGMVGWYSRFIKNEAEIKVPLSKLLRKDVACVWGPEQEQAFDTLKRCLSEAPVLEPLTKMDRSNVSEGQKRSYAAVVAGGGGERTPSVSLTASGEDEAAPSSVQVYASEEARASRDAEADLESYLSREELGASALSRREPEGMLVVEVSGVSFPASRDVPVEKGEIPEDWEVSVDPVDFHYRRPVWQRTDAEKRRARKQRRRRNRRRSCCWQNLRRLCSVDVLALFPQQQQQQQYHQQEAMVVDRRYRADRLISPVFWPSPTSEDADAPSRTVRGENFGGLEPVAFVSGLDSPRGACFNCHESGHGRQDCRRRPMRVFCTNCGRSGVKVHACPRCSKAWRKSQRNWHTKKKGQKARLHSVVQKIHRR
ncbi:unnamed protein product [Trichogramma brassicae]|uniref:RNA-directed DNA polymerase n=1 Tax=Trichogramma brassicae TaxID=86971 RepID=A0A6H5IHF5_9HYME|nr:unnamed protein product [Trichogramma brassicae]